MLGGGMRISSISQALLVVITLLLLVSSGNALEPVQLSGEYQLGGRLEHNGSPTSGKSHLYISLKNDAAKSLYESLDGEPAEDPCTGYRAKAQGNVGCYEITPNKEYFCSFSVNLERNAVEAGLGGCF
jgi:hypothetical protein